MLVLREIADDYEEPSHIRECVLNVARTCGLRVDPSETDRALLDLMSLGWAKPYDLYRQPPEELQEFPRLEKLGNYY